MLQCTTAEKRAIGIFSLSFPQAQRPDELDIHTDEELDVIEWDDGDGWCKGRNKLSKEGYFPQSYVQAASGPATPPKTSSNEGGLVMKNEEGDDIFNTHTSRYKHTS